MIRILALCVFSAFLLMAGCLTTGGQQNGSNMPNPASVYCEDNGGTLEIRTDAQGGQYGICKLAGGVECDEWAYYRGECGTNQTNQSGNGGIGGVGMANPASVYCGDNGGTLEIKSEPEGQ